MQLLHLRFHPIHFLFQTDECRIAPVQGSKTFAKYVSDYNWYNVNKTFILSQKVNIDEEHTQDIFILNMKHYNDIRNIVAVKRYSLHAYFANWYKEGKFKNFIAQIDKTFPDNELKLYLDEAEVAIDQQNWHNLTSKIEES